MQSFLKQAALKVFSDHPITDLQKLKIILPSRRATLYFKKELASLSEVPFFAPEIVSIDDFVKGNSILELLDPIDLYFEIFNIWKTLDPEQSFDKLLTWADIVLKDYDLIDMSLLDRPDLLFKYMSEAEILKRWEPGEDEFTFSNESKYYFTFFDRMSVCYEKLGQKLGENGVGYTGMIYRDVADNVNRWIDLDGLYYFIGLNALTLAEKKIVDSLNKAGIARFIWDTDQFYMESEHKAGSKLRNYKAEFGRDWNYEFDDLLSQPKTINVFKVGSTVQQAKLAVDLITKSTNSNQALIVLDDSLFPSLYLHLSGLEINYNISAGIGFKTTTLSGILEDYITLIAYIDKRIPIGALKSFLTNPGIKLVMNEELGETRNNSIYRNIFSQPRLFYFKSQLINEYGKSNTMTELLSVKNPGEVIDGLLALIEKYSNIALDEKAFGLMFIKELEKLKGSLNGKDFISIDTVKVLIKELVKKISIPFEREPDAVLQVMSMLETRGLDFEEITFLSFMEGNLPASKRTGSFLPFDAAKYFDLPIYTDQDAIMSYHFFRLLQRASKVNLIYTTGSTGLSKSEPSRFLYQIEEDLAVKNPKIKIEEYEVGAFKESENLDYHLPEIEKTPEIMSKIITYLTENGLSPTAINEYFRSPVSFYWKYIENIKSKEDEGADIAVNDFGSIVHHILERNEESYLGGDEINENTLNALRKKVLENLEDLVNEKAEFYDFKYGLNFVMYTIIKEIISKYYNMRIREYKEPYKIIEIEKRYEKILKVNGYNVKIKGIVDKVEQHGDLLKIIDFKTGKVDKDHIKIVEKKGIDIAEILAEKLREEKGDKLRQLCIYLLLIYDEFGKNTKYELKFYSFRNLDDDLILEIANHTNEEIILAIETLIHEIVEDLLDNSKMIKHWEGKAMSEYSDYYNLLS